MRNILQVENKFFKKYLTNDNILKIVSLVSALLLFFAINGNGGSFSEYFSSSATIEDVPLEVNYDTDNYVITGLPETINVLISGPDANVTSAKRKKDILTASLSLDPKEEGTKTVDANEITFSSIGDVNISPIVKDYEVQVQDKISKEMPIQVSYVNSSKLTDGLMLNDPQLSTDVVTVSGGSQDVSKVEGVKAIVDLSKLNDVKGNTAKIEAKLIAYDDQGQVVDNIEMSSNSINVTQKYTQNSVTLPVNYTFTNQPTDQFVSSVCDQEDSKDCKVTDGSSYKATVEVFGDRDKIEQMTSGVEYRINMASMNMNNNQVTATAVLPEGVYTKEPTKTVTVTLEDGVSKTIKNVPIIETGLDKGLTAKVVNRKDAFIDVKVTGAKSTINQIDGNNLSINVDLSGYKAGDTAVVPIQVDAGDYVTAEPAKETIELEITEE